MGQGGKCILLCADMDALPMKEESGETFACPTGTEAHTCGHDFHAAMLLGAAKMLKENEDKLEGTVNSDYPYSGDLGRRGVCGCFFHPLIPFVAIAREMPYN